MFDNHKLFKNSIWKSNWNPTNREKFRLKKACLIYSSVQNFDAVLLPATVQY